MLTDLQRRVRGIVARLPGGAAVALAGGAALIVTGVVRRGTEVLDFFTPYSEPVGPILEAPEAALAAAGLRVTRLQDSETRARLLIESDSDSARVDLAADFWLLPALRSAEGAVLADRELAADKTLALTGRAEARDYIDFQALAQRFTLTELRDLAAAKDAGFAPPLLAGALDYIDERDRDTFDVDDESHRELVAFAKTAARRLHGADARLRHRLDTGAFLRTEPPCHTRVPPPDQMRSDDRPSWPIACIHRWSSPTLAPTLNLHHLAGRCPARCRASFNRVGRWMVRW